MGDKVKLQKMKDALIEDLKRQSHVHCMDLHLKLIKCYRESWTGICVTSGNEFWDCYKAHLNKLKLENKDLLEFKIEA